MGSTIDIEAAGWDRVTGNGIAMAYETLQAQGAIPHANVTLGTVTPTQVAGNGDAFIDPGEDWKLDITLGNAGGLTAYGIVATLTSSTPGVVVTSGPVAYPNIAAGGSAPNPAATPFRFSVTTAAACGAAINFTLTVSLRRRRRPPTTASPSLSPRAAVGGTRRSRYSGACRPDSRWRGRGSPGRDGDRQSRRRGPARGRRQGHVQVPRQRLHRPRLARRRSGSTIALSVIS